MYVCALPCLALRLRYRFFWPTAKKIEVLCETLAQAEDPAAHPDVAERLSVLEVIGGMGWRRRVSGALIRHLEATQPMPPGAEPAAGAAGAGADGCGGGGGGWVYDDNKLIDLLRVLCATVKLLAAGGQGLGDHLYVLTPADCTGTGQSALSQHRPLTTTTHTIHLEHSPSPSLYACRAPHFVRASSAGVHEAEVERCIPHPTPERQC